MTKVTKREQALLDWLHSPAVHIYTAEERMAFRRERRQTHDEYRRACALIPHPYRVESLGLDPLVYTRDECEKALVAAQRDAERRRAEYRDPVDPQSPEEVEEVLRGLARKGAGPHWCLTPTGPRRYRR